MEHKVPNYSVCVKRITPENEQNAKSNCSEFLSSILNLPGDTKTRFDLENTKRPMSISNPSINKQIKKMPTNGLNKIIKNRTLNSKNLKTGCAYQKNLSSRSNSATIKPILKQTKSLESFKKASMQPAKHLNKPSLLLKKSKSADNLHQLKCTSNHSIGSSIKSTYSAKKSSLTNLSVANKRTHKSMDELHKNFNEINYLKMFEFIFSKPLSSTNGSKSGFIKNFYNFLEKNSKMQAKNSNNHLESKLEQMKQEIEQLKTKLNCTVQDSKSLSALIREKSPPKIQPQQTNLKLNDCDVVKIKNTNMAQNQTNCKNMNDLSYKINAQNQDSLIEKLQKDLLYSNEKNVQLEKMLEEKSKQIEHYGYLFREISENVNTLVKELENKENILVNQSTYYAPSIRPTNHESLNASISLSSLKENLTKFQFKLKSHEGFEHVQNNLAKKKLNDCPNDLSTTTSSNTLIDADSSFYSLKVDPKCQKNNLFRNLSTKNQLDKNQLLLQEKFNLNNLKLQQQQKHLRSKLDDDIDELNNAIVVNQINKSINILEDDDEEDEENEKIIIAMEDLSISTMQTSNTLTTNEDSMFSFRSEDGEDDFQENLKKLDEKIFNVKQMLQSMKAT